MKFMGSFRLLNKIRICLATGKPGRAVLRGLTL